MSGDPSTFPVAATESARRPERVPTREELPPLVARTPLAIVDESVTFLRLAPGLFLSVALVIMLPMRLIAAAAPGSSLRDARPDEIVDIFVANSDHPGAVTAAFGALFLESIALFTIATTYGQIAAAWFAGSSITATDVLLTSIKRSPLILAAWFLVHVAEAIGSIGFGIGLLLPATFLALAAPIMGAESLGPLDSMRRSTRLTRPAFGHVLAVWIVTGVFALVVRAAIEIVPSVIGLEGLNIPLWLVSGVADFVGSVVAAALIAAASVVLYIDQRVRVEGIDLEMAFSTAFPEPSYRAASVVDR